MLRSYFLVAWRNLLRNRVFSFINIAGLTAGMTVVFLIYLYVLAEHSFDSFHAHSERTYRLPISYEENGVVHRAGAGNHPALAPALKGSFPEIEAAARISASTVFEPATTVAYEPAGALPVNFDETKLFFADPELLDIFDLPLVEGDKSNCLKEPFSLVMTQKTATKYFGNTPALGKTVRLNGTGYTLTGVLKDLPPNTHLNFDLLASYPVKNFGADMWAWPDFLTYIRLAPGTDPLALEKKFQPFLEPFFAKEKLEYGFGTVVDLQPIEAIHLTSHLQDEMAGNGSERTVYFVGLLGIFILVIAWVNYINLSTAKAIERGKEVGMRKVSGASRGQLIAQFFVDALLINGISIFLATGLVTMLLPAFEQLSGSPIGSILMSTHELSNVSFWMAPVATLLVGIVVVGLYPSLLLSSFKPALVLKGKFTKSAAGIRLRRGLVGFQYVLSIVLIAGTITVSRQIDFMHEQDLGYRSEQMLIVKGPSAVDSTLAGRFTHFKDLQGRLPEVIRMARSTNVPGRTLPYVNSIRLFGHDLLDRVSAYSQTVDDQFFPTYEIPLVAGRNFTEDDRFSFPNLPNASSLIAPRDRTFRPEQNKIIINELLAKNLGFENPEDALHQQVRFSLWDEFTGEIIGVTKNYHQTSLKDTYDPIVYVFGSYEQWPSISLRVSTKDLPATIAKIKANYATAFPGNAFEYFFLDDYFNQQYTTEHQFQQVFSVLTALAILISCLGLLGLGIFSVSQRIKEIGIRKVLGAPVISILALFSRDSVKIVLLAYGLALPVIWLGADWWLQTFAFHIGMEWIIFVAPPVLLLLISIGVIVSIALKTALANPVGSLRSE
ncbi:ABC transporter permease [Chryseolinea lacunae]|uniref:ABC transporter permease n=1 Tax=Chryseolinea lacunae TaxID=2801331 RepID=A0ABS1KPM0_9BACT|nr:ABC transporter permease [Chryseolinea lacunae]MBL0741415.1 ABC transporter permease [Chryseolinea lacunae]